LHCDGALVIIHCMFSWWLWDGRVGSERGGAQKEVLGKYLHASGAAELSLMNVLLFALIEVWVGFLLGSSKMKHGFKVALLYLYLDVSRECR
jgi:hypothetical protein